MRAATRVLRILAIGLVFSTATTPAGAGPAPAAKFEFDEDCRTSYWLGYDAEFVGHVREFLEGTLATGLARLAEANPALERKVGRRLKRLGRVRLSCRSLALTDRIAQSERRRARIDLGDIAYFVGDLYNPKVRADQERYLGSARFDDRIRHMRNTAFHELLHLAGIRNQSNAHHNRVVYGNGTFERDLVYACSHVAFPDAFEGRVDEALAVATCRAGR